MIFCLCPQKPDRDQTSRGCRFTLQIMAVKGGWAPNGPLVWIVSPCLYSQGFFCYSTVAVIGPEPSPVPLGESEGAVWERKWRRLASEVLQSSRSKMPGISCVVKRWYLRYLRVCYRSA